IKDLENVSISWLEVSYESLIITETAMIDFFNPRLNVVRRKRKGALLTKPLRSEATWPVRVTVSAMSALKKIQEREREKEGIAPSYLQILSKLAIKEASK